MAYNKAVELLREKEYPMLKGKPINTLKVNEAKGY